MALDPLEVWRRHRTILNAVNRRNPELLARAIDGLTAAEVATVVLEATVYSGLGACDILALLNKLRFPPQETVGGVPVSRVLPAGDGRARRV